MSREMMLPLALALALFAPQGLTAQEEPPSRSPSAAGLMSFVVPGTGSFYAGNTGHGARHVVLGGGTLVLALARASDCDLGILGGTSDTEGCVVSGIAALVFIGNWLWSVSTAVGDAKEFNQRQRKAGLEVEPRLVALETTRGTAVGLELLRFAF